MKLIRQDTSFIVTDFKWDKKYTYTKYTRDDEHGPRTYQVNEKKVPSVTTILSATQSEDKKQSLDAWRQRVGYEQAQKITTQAASRGTEMHYVLENYLNGVGYLNLSTDGATARIMAHKIIDNMNPLKLIYGSEVSLAYEDKWAGSTDLVGQFNGKETIVDFKQSNKLKKEEWIEDYFYQIAAYSLAHKKNYGPIEQGLIAMCTKDGQYQQFLMDEKKLSEYESKWFDRVQKYHTMSVNE
jgi:ATP-dependent exoDNAse (exonuclease V) beta subunit